VIRAAKAGKHVICEKPMATSVADCQRMIDACRAANRTLSIGYRLHFDPYHLEVARLGREKVFGAVKNVGAEFGFVIRPGVWRLNEKLAGGGPLMDLGIYCVQAACYATGEDPVTVTAKFGPKTDANRFAEVEESIDWTLGFPSGAKSQGSCSYNGMMNHLRVEAASGWSELHSAFSYRGISGRTSAQKLSYPTVNQQALQMDGIAQSILAGRPSIVPGEMGLRDVRILMAIYEAARTGRSVSL
jgi:predicted dehydrogenase